MKSQAQARQSQIQQVNRELQQSKEAIQQNLANQKELQQTHQKSQQEVNNLKTALSQAESKVSVSLALSDYLPFIYYSPLYPLSVSIFTIL